MGEAGLITILFTDLVGSTELASDVGDVAADDLRRQHFADLREAIAATGGTEVKTIGDAVMVSYKGATDALAGGVAMQRAVERRNRGHEDRRLEMRVGVSAGDHSLGTRELKGLPVPIAVCDVDWRVPHDETLVPLPTFVDVSPGFPFVVPRAQAILAAR